MERTLLVGDFLLFNKQAYAPAGRLTAGSALSPGCARRYHRLPSHASAFAGQASGGYPRRPSSHRQWPGFVNGAPLNEPYAAFEPAPPNPFRDNFPARSTLTRGRSRLVAPDAKPHPQRRARGASGRVLRARRQPQSQQGFPLLGICAAPGHRRPPPRHLFLALPPLLHRCAAAAQQASDDRLGHERELAEKLAGFARWRRIFHVVH